jgi:ketosteroid isomerase-like protein
MRNQVEKAIDPAKHPVPTVSRSHIETTRIVLDAFLRRDIPSLLEHVALDVDWEYGSTSDVPWYKARNGKAEAREFFESLSAVEMLRFEPKNYLGQGDVVVVVIQADYRLRRNNRRVTYEDGILIFRYNERGEIARFAHRVDFHKAWCAYHEV